MGSQSKGAAVPAIVKLAESKDDDPRDVRWKIEVDSWYGDAGAPVWYRRPAREGSDELFTHSQLIAHVTRPQRIAPLPPAGRLGESSGFWFDRTRVPAHLSARTEVPPAEEAALIPWIDDRLTEA